MSIAKKGDRVKVHYVGTFPGGEVFDSSVARQEPIEFEVGAGQMIKGFDQAVEGMALNEQKTVQIPAAEAYGEKSEENMVKVERSQIPADIELKVGLPLSMQTQTGQPVQVTVAEVTDEHCVLDANHPMAGRDLVFDITLVEIL